MILDVANVPYVDATAEMYCLQGAPSIYSDLSTNHGSYGSWNECDIITLCAVVMYVMSQSCQLPGNLVWLVARFSCLAKVTQFRKGSSQASLDLTGVPF